MGAAVRAAVVTPARSNQATSRTQGISASREELSRCFLWPIAASSADNTRFKLCNSWAKNEDPRMTMADTLLAEFEQEARTTRKFLERLPADQLAWRPHAKSMSAGQL